jgi:signal peptidase I
VFPLLAQTQPAQANRLIDTIARTPLSRIILLVVVLTAIRLLVAPYLRSVPIHKRDTWYAACRFLNETFDAVIYAGVFVFLLIRPFCIQMFQIPTGSMLETLQINDFIVANKAVYRYSDPKVGDIVVFRPPNGAIQDPSYIDPDGQVNQDYIKRCVGVPGDLVEVKDGKLWRNGKPVAEPYLSDPNRYIKNFYKLVHYTGKYATGDYKNYDDAYVPVNAPFEFSSHPRINDGRSTGVPIGFNFVIAASSIVVIDGERQIIPKDDESRTPQEVRLNDELCDAPPARIPPGYFLMMGDNRNWSFDGRFWGLIPRSAIIGRSEAVMWPPSRWRRTH